MYSINYPKNQIYETKQFLLPFISYTYTYTHT
jgi:hypothetical protein